MFDEGCRI